MTYADDRIFIELQIDELVGEGSSLAALYANRDLGISGVRSRLTTDLALLSVRFKSFQTATAVLSVQMGMCLTCSPLDVLISYLTSDRRQVELLTADVVIVQQKLTASDRLSASEYSIYDSDAVQWHFFGNIV